MQPLERIPFWPKLWVEYPGAQEAPFCDMDLKSLHEWIGSDYLQMPDVPGCIKVVRSTTSTEHIQEGNDNITVFHTPHGQMRSVWRYDEEVRYKHPVEYPVKGPDDIKLMIEFCRDAVIELDEEGLAAAKKQASELGEEAFIAACCGTSPLMQWVEHTAGVENSHFLLADHQDLIRYHFDRN